jgi:hypothetical protein
MNDHELMTVVRETFADVHSGTAVERIVSRGRALRARRRASGMAAAVGVGATGALVVGVALPASHPGAGHLAASHPTASRPVGGPQIRLAAWTVTRQADGTIKITFRQATDAAGLQRTLRADGIPASVTFSGQQNPACRLYTFSGSKPTPPGQPFRGPLSGLLNWSSLIQHPKSAYTRPYALVINPLKLPSGAGLEISTSGTPGAADNFQLNVNVVRASPQCT